MHPAGDRLPLLTDRALPRVLRVVADLGVPSLKVGCTPEAAAHRVQ